MKFCYGSPNWLIQTLYRKQHMTNSQTNKRASRHASSWCAQYLAGFTTLHEISPHPNAQRTAFYHMSRSNHTAPDGDWKYNSVSAVLVENPRTGSLWRLPAWRGRHSLDTDSAKTAVAAAYSWSSSPGFASNLYIPYDRQVLLSITTP